MNCVKDAVTEIWKLSQENFNTKAQILLLMKLHPSKSSCSRREYFRFRILCPHVRGVKSGRDSKDSIKSCKPAREYGCRWREVCISQNLQTITKNLKETEIILILGLPTSHSLKLIKCRVYIWILLQYSFSLQLISQNSSPPILKPFPNWDFFQGFNVSAKLINREKKKVFFKHLHLIANETRVISI